MKQRPSFARVLFSEEIFQNEKVLTEKVAYVMAIHQEYIAKIIKKAQSEHQIRDDIPPEHLSLLIMGALRLIVTKWRMSNLEFDLFARAGDVFNSLKLVLRKETI
ncbi:MAG: hypothetical protein MZU95_04495 [Desulfomicrobium escambiense]|nr:hypothetical protein [Desulfomicrobium escambiense]